MADDYTLADTIQGRQLAEVAGLALELSRDLQQRAMAAEDKDQAARLAQAFARVTRVVGWSVGMQHRIGRQMIADRRAEQRERREALIADPDRQTRIRVQRAEICDVVEPMIWSDREHLEARCLQTRFNNWLQARMDAPGFETYNPDSLIDAALVHLGIDVPEEPAEAVSPAHRESAPRQAAAAADSS